MCVSDPPNHSSRQKSVDRFRHEWVAAWCALMPMTVFAQNATNPAMPEVMAQIQSLDRFEAEQERLRELIRSQPPAYADKVMEETDDGAGMQAAIDARNEPMGVRSWLVESRLGWSEQSATGLAKQRNTEAGLRLEYRLETLNHGEWDVQADTRQRVGTTTGAATSSFFSATESRQSGRITLRNQGLPVTPFMFADSAVGDISSEVTDGLSRGQRLSLGSSTVRGASTRLFSREHDVRLGWGERGRLAGGPYPGFERTEGEVFWGGYTRRFDDEVYASVQLNRAIDAPWIFGNNGLGVLPVADTTSSALTLGQGYALFNDGDRRARVTVLGSRSNVSTGESVGARGWYVEGGLQAGAYRHEAGLYTTQPRLSFGDQFVSDGAKGLFWRMDKAQNRLNWGIGLDHEKQPDTGLFNSGEQLRTGVNANWQYRIDRRSSWGGYLQQSLQRIRDAAAGQRSSYGNAYYQTSWSDWGDTIVRLTLRRNQSLVNNGPAASGEEIEWEQDWIRRQQAFQGDLLRTTLGWARDRSETETQTYPTASVTWQTWLASDWNLNANLRYTSRSGNLSTSRGLSGSLQTEKRMSPGWTLGASLLLNQAVVNVDTGGLPGTISISRSDDKTALVYLRYEGQRGQPYGFDARGSQGAGAGRISGVVFFDANRDGVQQPNEAGVPGVEVLLNERARSVTDDRGRYEFALVPTGPQRLSLRPETVPLPWGEGPQSRTVVEVPLRGEAVAPLGVTRVNN